MTLVEAAFSTEDVADMSGLTLRQLRGHCAAGVFGPGNSAPGSGVPRSFDSTDVLIAGALCRLADAAEMLVGRHALSHALAQRVADEIRRTPGGRWLTIVDGRVVIDGPSGPAPYIAVDLQDIR